MAFIPIQDDAHWHQLRAKHVGGSEVAALFGACSYLTLLELWLIKRGDISGEIPDNDRMFWGRLLEDGIARGLALKRHWIIENPKAYATCDDTPGMGCTPDRFIVSADERPTPGLLQIKNVDRLVFMKWEDGQPPLQYELQVQHELACTGLSWGVLAVLVGGNDLKVFIYEAHTGAIARIKRAIGDFWASVASGKMPTAVGDDYDIVRDLYGDAWGDIVDMTADNQLPILCATALEAAERRIAAEKDEKAAKALILQKVGEASYAKCAGGFEIKRTQVNRSEHLTKASSFIKLTIKEGKAA